MTGNDADYAEDSMHETKERYHLSLRDRMQVALFIIFVGTVITAALASVAWLLPFPPAWQVEGVIIFIGMVMTMFLVMGAFFAPGKEVEPDGGA